MTDSSDLPGVVERFLRYVRIDTQSDADSKTTPSTEKQKDLSRLLADELRALGLADAEMDEHGYVYATLPSTLTAGEASASPTVALVAHVDTAPGEPGGPVVPVIHRGYDGSVIALPGKPTVTLDPARSPALLDHIGHDLISSDGTTLLGSDDKAGVAVIMQLAEDLLADVALPRPPIRICFTVDEEIGRGVDKLDLERLGADVAYTIDGSGTGTLSFETFNAAEAVIEVTGVNVHPGYAKDVMANAVTTLAGILSRLPGSEAPETTAGREGYWCPMEFEGTISTAKAKMILRDFTWDGLTRRKRVVESLVDAARLEHPRTKIELTITDQYKNMRTYIEEKDLRAVSFALEAAKEMGIEIEVELVRGGTDGSRMSEMGLPTPNVFNGGHDYHSRFEWNTVQNLELSLKYVKRLVRYWAAHGRDPVS
ncbi:MAG: peptidase T [Acidobacteriota bacterium]|nr:peptidase T [Acidobacteriota bacterium]